jgi:hypothetical protein
MNCNPTGIENTWKFSTSVWMNTEKLLKREELNHVFQSHVWKFPTGWNPKKIVCFCSVPKGDLLLPHSTSSLVSAVLVTPKLCTLQDDGNITYYQHGISCFYLCYYTSTMIVTSRGCKFSCWQYNAQALICLPHLWRRLLLRQPAVEAAAAPLLDPTIDITVDVPGRRDVSAAARPPAPRRGRPPALPVVT